MYALPSINGTPSAPSSFGNMDTFGSSASKVIPVPATFTNGYLPGQGFPAENENYLMYNISNSINQVAYDLYNIHSEILSVLSSQSITPNGSTTQLNTAISGKITTTVTASYMAGLFAAYSGNLGIGKSPSYKLDVNGTINGVTDVLVNGDSLAGVAGYAVGTSGGKIPLLNGSNTWSGSQTFSTIPAFNGGTSGSTAPFTVDSTFQVNNLNASYLEGYNTGTSGGSIPLLNGVNTWSAIQTFNAIPAFNGGTSGASAPFTVDSTFLVTNLNSNYLQGYVTGTSGGAIPLLNGANTWSSDQIFSGNALIGGDPGATITASANLTVSSTSTNGNIALTTFNTTSTSAPNIKLQKSRGASVGALSSVLAADLLGQVLFRGVGGNNTTFYNGASIDGYVESVGTTYVNAYIKFSMFTSGTGAEVMRITNSGDIGIGVTDPLDKLEASGLISTTGQAAETSFVLRRINGTRTSPTKILNNDKIGSIHFRGQYNTTVGNTAIGAYILATATADWSSGTAHPTMLQFFASSTSGAAAEYARINSTGNFLIGTTTDDATNKLQVNGSVTATKFDSSVSTGTAPFTVASTTKVTNLNSDMVDNYHVGTSGDSIPLLNSVNTWSAIQTFNAIPAFNGGTSGSTAPFTVDSTTMVSNLNSEFCTGLSGYSLLSNSQNINTGNQAGSSYTPPLVMIGSMVLWVNTNGGNQTVTLPGTNSSVFAVAIQGLDGFISYGTKTFTLGTGKFARIVTLA